jgi:hypothetical protein
LYEDKKRVNTSDPNFTPNNLKDDMYDRLSRLGVVKDQKEFKTLTSA